MIIKRIVSLVFLLLSFNANSADDLSLSDIFNLSTSIVSKKEESVFLAPSNVTVIKREQILAWGSRNLKDVMKRVAGYQVIPDRDEWVFASRGNVSDNNTKYLILIDGHRMNSYENFGPGQIIEAPFDLAHVKSIEIIRGPGSTVWGPDALAGVVNVKTLDAEDYETYKKEASITYGTGNTYRANFQAAKVVSKKASALLTASVVSSDGHEIYQDKPSGLARLNDNEKYRTHVDRHEPSFMLHFKSKVENLKVNAMHFNTKTHNRHYETWLSRNAQLTTEKTFIESVLEESLTENSSLTWKSWYHSNLAEYRPVNFSGLYIQWKDQVVGTSLDGNLFVNDMLNFIWGAEFTWAQAGPNPRLNPGNVSNTSSEACDTSASCDHKVISGLNTDDHSLGGYLVGEFAPTKDWKIVLGSRVDRNNGRSNKGEETSFNPRVGVAYQFLPTQSLKLMYNQGFLQPSNFNRGPSVKAETMKQYEAQWLSTFKNSFLTLTLYKQKLEGFINIVGGSISGFTNSGDYESKGIELEYIYNFSKIGKLWSNISYADATAGKFNSDLGTSSRRVLSPDQEDSRLLSYSPFVANLGTDLKIGKFKVSPAMRYVAPTWYRSGPVEGSATDAETKYSKTDTMVFADLNITYSPRENIEIGLLVDNLTNEIGPTHNTVWNGEVELAGRVLEGKFKYKF